jgi:ribosomal protein L40E
MEEGKKKLIMVVIIVASIIAAVVITLATRSGGGEGGLDTIKGGQMIWLKCRSPKCENTWQMDRKAYYEYIEKNRMGMVVPGVPCPKCNEKDGYRAEKCGKCGNIFERVVTNDFADRCPKCNYSAMEELRKQSGGKTAAPVAAPAAPAPATPAAPAAPAAEGKK